MPHAFVLAPLTLREITVPWRVRRIYQVQSMGHPDEVGYVVLDGRTEAGRPAE